MRLNQSDAIAIAALANRQGIARPVKEPKLFRAVPENQTAAAVVASQAKDIFDAHFADCQGRRSASSRTASPVRPAVSGVAVQRWEGTRLTAGFSYSAAVATTGARLNVPCIIATRRPGAAFSASVICWRSCPFGSICFMTEQNWKISRFPNDTPPSQPFVWPTKSGISRETRSFVTGVLMAVASPKGWRF